MLNTVCTDVYKQRSFIYTGKEVQLHWEEYGIKLHFFPCTSDVYIKGTISVLSVDAENYKFPEGTGLVSAIYDIVADKPFPVPVTIEIQHCVLLQDENEVPHLGITFVIADAQKGPPYIFHELCHGDFKPRSTCGEIQLTHFCILGIIIKWWLSRPILCFASLYYPQNDMAVLVVTKNLRAHITVSQIVY